MKLIAGYAATLFIAVAACAPAAAPSGDAARPAGAAPADATGLQGESCIAISQIRESRVRDDSTIDFIMRDGRTFRNTLPGRCPSLGFEEAFTYSTSLSQLCSTDIIRVIHQGGGPQLGAACGLGKFVPYTPEAKPAG
jgi:hypothetical protein